LLLLVFLVFMHGCKNQHGGDRANWDRDRFVDSFRDLAEIAEIKQITDAQRDLTPSFSASGDLIYFTRFLIINPNDSLESDESTKPQYFSYDYRNNKLSLLDVNSNSSESTRVFQQKDLVPPESLPSTVTESPLFGYKTPYGTFFCAEQHGGGITANIYQLIGDSLTQVTYGAEPSLLESITPAGRRLAFTYGKNYYRTVLLDIPSGKFYSLPRGVTDTQIFELSPCFSPDGHYMVFVVSNDLFNANGLPLGDIWLAEFIDQ